jgi:fibronectin type 3 domain-containing protein
MRAIVKVALAAMLALAIAGLIWFRVGTKPHSVTLNWQESPSVVTARVVGYNVYRSRTSGGQYAKLAARVPRPPYEDRLVNSGETYFYVVTAVDEAGHESRFSAEIKLKIP